MASNSHKNKYLSTEEADRIISEAAAKIPMPAPPSLAIQRAGIASKIHDPDRVFRAKWSLPIGLGVAAAVMIPIFIFIIAEWVKAPPEFYETAAGETKQIILTDGSTVTLAGNSNLRVLAAFNVNNRSVELSGEAFFEVTKGSEPFKIETGDTEVTVLGTKFNIKETGRQVSLHVYEGLVSFSDLRNSRAAQEIPAGWMARFRPDRGIMPRVTFDPKNQPEPRKKSFFFEDTPLREVCKRLEDSLGILIEMDPDLADQRVNGLIKSDDPREIFELLAALIPISWEERVGHFRISAKTQE